MPIIGNLTVIQQRLDRKVKALEDEIQPEQERQRIVDQLQRPEIAKERAEVRQVEVEPVEIVGARLGEIDQVAGKEIADVRRIELAEVGARQRFGQRHVIAEAVLARIEVAARLREGKIDVEPRRDIQRQQFDLRTVRIFFDRAQERKVELSDIVVAVDIVEADDDARRRAVALARAEQDRSARHIDVSRTEGDDRIQTMVDRRARFEAKLRILRVDECTQALARRDAVGMGVFQRQNLAARKAEQAGEIAAVEFRNGKLDDVGNIGACNAKRNLLVAGSHGKARRLQNQRRSVKRRAH